jgi:hypothetical protein
MSVIDVLRKIGVLRAGSESYKGKGQILGDFYGAGQPGRSQAANDATTQASSAAPAVESARQAQAPRVSHSGRKIFFVLALIVAVLCVLVIFASAGLSLWSLLALLTWAGFVFYANGFAYGNRGAVGGAAGLFIAAMVLSFVFLAMGSPDVNKSASLGTSVSSGLTIGDVTWANVGEDKTLRPVSGDEFERGQVAGLVLRNVSGFEKGPDGKHWFDLSLRIEDAQGRVLFMQEGLLGEGGRGVLPDGIAESPFTYVDTGKLAPGRYSVELGIYDRLGNGKATARRALVVK